MARRIAKRQAVATVVIRGHRFQVYPPTLGTIERIKSTRLDAASNGAITGAEVRAVVDTLLADCANLSAAQARELPAAESLRLLNAILGAWPDDNPLMAGEQAFARLACERVAKLMMGGIVVGGALRDDAHRKELAANVAADAIAPFQPVAPPADETPEWNPVSGELRYRGKVVRLVAGRARNVRLILDSFGELGWPPRIDSPIGDDATGERRREAVRTLNDGLRQLEFSLDGRRGIVWVAT
jgi:hypothetical protein